MAALKILFLALELETWREGRSHTYAAGLGFEEGFSANGVEYFTLTTPCFRWAEQLCKGQRFDQVWLYAIQSRMNDAQRSWVGGLAPVRVGIAADSIEYTDEELQLMPHLAELRHDFQAWLPWLTHVVAFDELVADFARRIGHVKAIWCPSAVPSRFVEKRALCRPRYKGLFSGTPYHWRKEWLEHRNLQGVLTQQQSPEQGTLCPIVFASLHANVQRYLNRPWLPCRRQAVRAYLQLLRAIRRRIFARWLRSLQSGSAVVNLPHYFKSYSGRVIEGMAAGRPVLSWRIPERPLNAGLFTDEEEILLFSREDPDKLVKDLNRIQNDPVFGTKIAERARLKLLSFHTIEHRVRQLGLDRNRSTTKVFLMRLRAELITRSPVAMNPSSSNKDVTTIAKQTYIRQRLSPQTNDLLYLHLSDLRLAIQPLVTDDQLIILDYGADLSPYIPLFPHSDYRAADVGEHPDLAYRIGTDGRVPEKSQLFDLVISTQVVEHVENPALYLIECYRLLKPGGTLFLTTHGSFEDHGFPNDYQRWTAQGLERDLLKTGFHEIKITKMTVGPRAVLFQIERCLETTWLRRSTLPGMLHWIARYVFRALRPGLHWLADRWYSDYRLVSSETPYQYVYLGLAALARRPFEKNSDHAQDKKCEQSKIDA